MNCISTHPYVWMDVYGRKHTRTQTFISYSINCEDPFIHFNGIITDYFSVSFWIAMDFRCVSEVTRSRPRSLLPIRSVLCFSFAAHPFLGYGIFPKRNSLFLFWMNECESIFCSLLSVLSSYFWFASAAAAHLSISLPAQFILFRASVSVCVCVCLSKCYGEFGQVANWLFVILQTVFQKELGKGFEATKFWKIIDTYSMDWYIRSKCIGNVCDNSLPSNHSF